MPLLKLFFLLVSSCLLTVSSFGQAANYGSPYSRFGLGDQQPFALAHHRAMANATTAMFDSVALNLANPASLSALRLTAIEFGGFGQVSRLQTNTASQYRSNINFAYLMFGFPVTKKWGTAIGFQPYAFTNYNISGRVDSSFVGWREEYRGIGGINQLTWANGVDLGRGFHLGIGAHFLFGDISQERRLLFDFPDSLYFLSLRVTDKVTVADILFNVGLQYRKEWNTGAGKRDRRFFAFGVTADIPGNLSATNDFVADRIRLVGSRVSVLDTVSNQSGIRGDINMPLAVAFGVQLGVHNWWQWVAEARYTTWSSFSQFNRPDSLVNSLSLASGFQFIPKYDATGDNTFFKTMRYRAGIKYNSGFLALRGQQISELGMTFGVGIPIKRQFSMPAVNLAVEVGRRGSLNNGLVRESYTRVTLGFTLNDRWFVKRKYD